MSRALFLECTAGIAGDMFAAAFLDAGLIEADTLRSVPASLGLDKTEVRISRVLRAGVEAARIEVIGGEAHLLADHPHHQHSHEHQQTGPANGVGHHSHHHHEHARGSGDIAHHSHAAYRQVGELIRKSGLSEPARDFALAVYRELARAEANAHGTSLDEVVFHEVGAVDSIVDVAMAGICVAMTAADRHLCTPVSLGRGFVRMAHGTFPIPAPASARLAEGFRVAPVSAAITAHDVELATPTGLAILRCLQPTFVDGWPAGTLRAQGAGAGSRNLGAFPNVVRVALLEEDLVTPDLPYFTDTVIEITFNVDDQTGEQTGWILERAFDWGALDAWATHLIGKKGRPAVQLSFLVERDAFPRLADRLLRESTTFGLRYRLWDRLKLGRREESRAGPDGSISYKIGFDARGAVVKEKPEFDQAIRAREADWTAGYPTMKQEP